MFEGGVNFVIIFFSVKEIVRVFSDLQVHFFNVILM